MQSKSCDFKDFQFCHSLMCDNHFLADSALDEILIRAKAASFATELDLSSVKFNSITIWKITTPLITFQHVYDQKLY